MEHVLTSLHRSTDTPQKMSSTAKYVIRKGANNPAACQTGPILPSYTWITFSSAIQPPCTDKCFQNKVLHNPSFINRRLFHPLLIRSRTDALFSLRLQVLLLFWALASGERFPLSCIRAAGHLKRSKMRWPRRWTHISRWETDQQHSKLRLFVPDNIWLPRATRGIQGWSEGHKVFSPPLTHPIISAFQSQGILIFFLHYIYLSAKNILIGACYC